ncbi:MAG: PA14 domain-containing protein [Candidatus Binataceae bacterium]
MRQTISAPHDSLPPGAEATTRRSAAAFDMPITMFVLMLALGLTAFGGRPAAARADDNVVANGDLSQGAPGKTPEHWSTEAWIAAPDATTYKWTSGELEIESAKANDARWIQNLHIGPGWYYFTADIRSTNVAEGNTGASIGLMEDGIISQQLHGTKDWTKVGFYLKGQEHGADIVLDCRLGGYASLNTGQMACRNFKGVKVGAPPDNEDTPRYDLDIIRNGGTPPPSSGPGANVALPLALAILVLAGLFAWRRFGRQWMRRVWTNLQHLPAGGSAMPLPPDATRQRIEITLLVVALLSFAYFYQAADHSTGSRFDLVRSILERGSLWIDGYCGYNTADIVELHSHIYSNKAPGGAFTGLLPWLFVTSMLRIFLTENQWFWAFATHLTTVFSVSLLSSILVVLTYRFALRLGASNGRAVALALILAFATILFPYATEFTGEPIAALSVFASFYLLAWSDPGTEPWRLLAAGLLAGWSVVCDYPTFVLAAGVGIYAICKLRDWRKIAPFAIGAGVCAVVLALYNKFAFGNALFLSYEAYMGAANASRFPEQSVGFAGVTYPRWQILWDVLLSPDRGLYICNPVLILAFPGLYFFWRRSPNRAELMLIAYAIISFILFNGSYGNSIIYWGGGTATGPRHMLSAVPFMVLAMAFLPKRLDPLIAVLALASVFIMLMATAIEPHLPYEYDNPLRDFLWPAYLRGDFGYNKGAYFGGPPIAGDSIAFNLGKLAGLPGAIQLWPLAAVWLAGAWELMRNLEFWNNRTLRLRMAAVSALAIVTIVAPPTFGAIFLRPNLNEPHGLMGRYYEGLRDSQFPPHIQRVDRQIDFDSIVALGSLPYPSYATWTGKIIAPVTGTYHFGIMVDDAGWLKLDGRPVIADPGDVTKDFDSGEIFLTAGKHRIELGERNIWGGASMRFLWRPPGGQQEVVPSQYLIPERVGRGKPDSDLVQKAQG